MSLRTLLVAAVLAVAALFLYSREPATWPIRNAPAGAGAIVCFGDSLTRGAGADEGESYPAVLGQLLGREVVNRGRDGETSESALERLERDVVALEPAVVILTLGGNDILRRLPVETTLRSMREIFTRSLATGAMVVFLAIDPPFVSGERMEEIRGLARELGVLYVDSVTDDLWGDPKRMADRIHPNAAGYRLVAERVHDVLRERL